jgi:hypothetical protein
MPTRHLDTSITPVKESGVDVPTIRPGNFRRDPVGEGITLLQDTLTGFANQQIAKKNKQAQKEAKIIDNALIAYENSKVENTYNEWADELQAATGVSAHMMGGELQRRHGQRTGRIRGGQITIELSDLQTTTSDLRTPQAVADFKKQKIEELKKAGISPAVFQGVTEGWADGFEAAHTAAVQFQLTDTQAEQQTAIHEELDVFADKFDENGNEDRMYQFRYDLRNSAGDVAEMFDATPGMGENTYLMWLEHRMQDRDNWDSGRDYRDALVDGDYVHSNEGLIAIDKMMLSVDENIRKREERPDPDEEAKFDDLSNRITQETYRVMMAQQDGKEATFDEDLIYESYRTGRGQALISEKASQAASTARNLPGFGTTPIDILQQKRQTAHEDGDLKELERISNEVVALPITTPGVLDLRDDLKNSMNSVITGSKDGVDDMVQTSLRMAVQRDQLAGESETPETRFIVNDPEQEQAHRDALTLLMRDAAGPNGRIPLETAREISKDYWETEDLQKARRAEKEVDRVMTENFWPDNQTEAKLMLVELRDKPTSKDQITYDELEEKSVTTNTTYESALKEQKRLSAKLLEKSAGKPGEDPKGRAGERQDLLTSFSFTTPVDAKLAALKVARDNAKTEFENRGIRILELEEQLAVFVTEDARDAGLIRDARILEDSHARIRRPE